MWGLWGFLVEVVHMVIVIAVRVWVVGEFYLVEVASGAGAGMQETDLLFG